MTAAVTRRFAVQRLLDYDAAIAARDGAPTLEIPRHDLALLLAQCEPEDRKHAHGTAVRVFRLHQM